MTEVNKIKNNSLLTRGVSAVYPSLDFVNAKLNKGEKLTIYLGIDPTGPTLHLGHAIALRKLSEFQRAGHKVIMLMGDFTAMIGDPTDKSATRKQLTHKEVMNNLKNYKKQASKILSFSGKNSTKVMFNSKWLGKMKFEDVLNLASNMTVSQMLERDMFEKRIKEGKQVYIHEFMYPLMQGYDSIAMDVDGEIGGNDQMFNMLTGRNLMKSIKGKEKFVITMKLLEDNNGKKMGKTEGNMISLSDSTKEMFGKVMSWNDNLIIPGFELCTDVPMEDISSIASDITRGALNPRDAKMRLAREIIKIFYSEEKANQVQEEFIATFSKKEIPENIDNVFIKEGELLIDLLVKEKVVNSKSDYRRLVDEGAVTDLNNDIRVTDYNTQAKNTVYRIGKKRFIKINFK